ncbi:hypothetical protein [Streptomyces sp. SYP-A7193]|uniref:hypothetical protein n=1 Tax=Streptomyces sp. SYP-A7193 TaxID=2662065 RepID=UPI001D179C00|nr:hypothetical protein [Streptomyces sp. SYP-A7193]
MLYLLNVSNPNRLSADSGFTFAELLAPALADTGAEVTVSAPAPVGDPRVRYVATASPSTKYRARFDPGLDALVAVMRDVRPDVVVANQVEAAPAVRAALLEARVDALVAGYCHYLPFSFTAGQQMRLDRPWTTGVWGGVCSWRSRPVSRPVTGCWSTRPQPCRGRRRLRHG